MAKLQLVSEDRTAGQNHLMLNILKLFTNKRMPETQRTLVYKLSPTQKVNKITSSKTHSIWKVFLMWFSHHTIQREGVRIISKITKSFNHFQMTFKTKPVYGICCNSGIEKMSLLQPICFLYVFVQKRSQLWDIRLWTWALF